MSVTAGEPPGAEAESELIDCHFQAVVLPVSTEAKERAFAVMVEPTAAVPVGKATRLVSVEVLAR